MTDGDSPLRRARDCQGDEERAAAAVAAGSGSVCCLACSRRSVRVDIRVHVRVPEECSTRGSAA